MTKRKNPRKPFIRFLFVVYGALMLWLLFGRSSGWGSDRGYAELLAENFNLTPFQTIRDYWKVIYHRTNDTYLVHCSINLVGNVVMFIPIGWLLPSIFKTQRNFLVFLLTCGMLVLSIELIQWLTLLGRFDIDDIILNMIGLLLGFVGYGLQSPRKKKK